MQFAARLLAFSAAISQALALVSLTNSNWAVTEGTPFEITWTDAVGPVTLLLKDGPSTNLATVSTIGSGLTGTSFSWTPSGIPSGTYAVEINDSTDTNYGSQFTYAGTGVATTASTTAAASTTASSESTATTDMSTTSVPSTLATSTATSNVTSTATDSATTKSASKTTPASSSTATNTPLNTNASQKMGSPLALVLLTFAAMVLCH